MTASLILAALMFEEITDTAVTSGRGVFLLSVVTVVMVAVGLLGAFGPARRGLQINPTESLRSN